MKQQSGFIVCLLMALVSCNESVNSNKLARYEQCYREFEKADYAFSGFYDYHRFRDFDLNSFTDTVLACQEDIFSDPYLLKALKKDLTAWLRDSVFIAHLRTPQGTMLVDTTNMLFMSADEDLHYYMEEKIRKGQDLDGKLFETRNSSHVFRMNGKTVYFELVPANAHYLREIGEYRIETTGKFIPAKMHVGGKSTLSNLRYLCDAYRMDWFLTIASDDFPGNKRKLALCFSGESVHYRDEPGRKDTDYKKRTHG